jgi:hypothetical protein
MGADYTCLPNPDLLLPEEDNCLLVQLIVTSMRFAEDNCLLVYLIVTSIHLKYTCLPCDIRLPEEDDQCEDVAKYAQQASHQAPNFGHRLHTL